MHTRWKQNRCLTKYVYIHLHLPAETNLIFHKTKTFSPMKTNMYHFCYLNQSICKKHTLTSFTALTKTNNISKVLQILKTKSIWVLNFKTDL